MNQAELWIIAGPNGAGKTTLVRRSPIRELLPDVVALNPDDRAQILLRERGYSGFAAAPPSELRQSFIQAANEVYDELKERLRRNEKVSIETVLSTDKYSPIVERVRAAGGFIGMIYVHCARRGWRASALPSVFAAVDTMFRWIALLIAG